MPVGSDTGEALSLYENQGRGQRYDCRPLVYAGSADFAGSAALRNFAL